MAFDSSPDSTLAAMKQAKRWLVWKFEGGAADKKPRKVPYYVSGGRRGKTDTPEDVEMLASFSQAAAFCKAESGCGVEWEMGFALGPDGAGGHWQGVDFDGTLEGKDELPGYVEISPSGNGYHGIGYGQPFEALVSPFEAYSHGRFFTFTGKVVRDDPIYDFLEFVAPHLGRQSEHLSAAELEAKKYTIEQIFSAAQSIANPDLHWEGWNRVGMALFAAVGEEEAARARGYAAWVDFSSRCAKFDPKEVLERWQHFDKSPPGKIGAGTIVYLARKSGWKPEIAKGDPYLTDGENNLSRPGAFSLRSMEFVIENFVRTGLYAFFGPFNAGKTQATVAMALHVAGLVDVGLPRSLRREVYYLTEDPEQIFGIVAGYRQAGMLDASDEEIGRWFKIYSARRWKGEVWSVDVGRLLEESRKASGERVWGQPLVVFDTAASNFDIEDISNNAAVSSVIAALKQASLLGPLTLSVWIVLHVPKSSLGENVERLTALGAQAWGADAVGEVKFGVDGGKVRGKGGRDDGGDGEGDEEKVYRVVLGKRRFEIVPDESGKAVDCLTVESLLLPAVSVETPWGGEVAALSAQSRVLRVVQRFVGLTLGDVQKERGAAAGEQRFKELWRKAQHGLEVALKAAERDGKAGVAIRIGSEAGRLSKDLAGNFEAMNLDKVVGGQVKDRREDIISHLFSEFPSNKSQCGKVLYVSVDILGKGDLGMGLKRRE